VAVSEQPSLCKYTLFINFLALEFAYTEAPCMMQGMLMGVNHLTTGIGALLASAIYNIVATVTAANGMLIEKLRRVFRSSSSFKLRNYVRKHGMIVRLQLTRKDLEAERHGSMEYGENANRRFRLVRCERKLTHDVCDHAAAVAQFFQLMCCRSSVGIKYAAS
jgi:POT family